MGFVRPELLLLALPAGYVLWRTRSERTPTNVLRALVLLALVLALAGPYGPRAAEGRDLVVVVDRSRSMPAGSLDLATEWIELSEDERRAGDRLAVVTFGSETAVERLPSETARFEGFQRAPDPEGSRLADALDAALELVPEGRRASLVVLSDGEAQGRDPLDAARRAFARGVRIDVRPVLRPPVADLSVQSLELPQEVVSGEPFQFSGWVRADARVEAEYVLRSRSRIVSRGRRVFEPGLQRLLFRDVLDEAGVTDYVLELDAGEDRVPENDRGLGAVRVRGENGVLVLNPDGQEDTLSRLLARSGFPVRVARPEEIDLDPVATTAWRAVVLENVAAQRVGRVGMRSLAEFVRERGGGLLMTGGKASFGVGGYHLTPIDEVLPVSMEVRPEHRKQGVAMVIVMDRSGSMGAPAGGSTKMDLANRGAVAAIQLLSPIDSIAVLAVDTSPTVVQELTPVESAGPLESRVLRTRSGGGGIYVHTGLLAAGRELEGATQVNHHVILFADAADAEEQEQCLELASAWHAGGRTVSVIALGTETDVHAGFLRNLAAAGGGQVYFTTSAVELPTLFARDTLTVARSSFVSEPLAVRVLPDLHGLGRLELEAFPTLDGYNLNYPKPGATVGLLGADEYATPVLAFWQRGLGRCAALSGQVGGSHGGSLVASEEFPAFAVTLLRWLSGPDEPEAFYPTVRREGGELVVEVEVDRERETPPDAELLLARLRQPDGTYTDHRFQRVDEARFEARAPISKPGVVLGTLRVDEERFLQLPPVSLPYSPEFERPIDPGAGERTLLRLAEATGGAVDPAVHELFRGPRDAREHRLFVRECLLAGLLLLLLEIAGRRLGLWSRRRAEARVAEVAVRRRKPARRAPEPVAEPAPKARTSRGGVGSALEEARSRANRRLRR